METSTWVAIMTSQLNNQTPLFYSTTQQDKTKLHLSEKITSETQPDELLKAIKLLTETLNKFIEKDENFKRKLTVVISSIRESNGDIADKLDELIHDWNTL